MNTPFHLGWNYYVGIPHGGASGDDIVSAFYSIARQMKRAKFNIERIIINGDNDFNFHCVFKSEGRIYIPYTETEQREPIHRDVGDTESALVRVTSREFRGIRINELRYDSHPSSMYRPSSYPYKLILGAEGDIGLKYPQSKDVREATNNIILPRLVDIGDRLVEKLKEIKK